MYMNLMIISAAVAALAVGGRTSVCNTRRHVRRAD